MIESILDNWIAILVSFVIGVNLGFVVASLLNKSRDDICSDCELYMDYVIKQTKLKHGDSNGHHSVHPD